MDGVKEYIFPVYDVDADEYKEYIGFIRSKPELIRCKDCAYYTSLGECSYYLLMNFDKDNDDYCSNAKPKEDS